MPSETLLRSFSSPYEQQFAGLAESISNLYTRQTLSIAIEPIRSNLDDASDGLVGFVQDWVAGAEAVSDVTFDPSFGRLINSHPQQPSQQVVAASQVAIQLALAGHVGQWRVRYDTPARLRYRNYLLSGVTEFAAEHATNGERQFIARIGDRVRILDREIDVGADSFALPLPVLEGTAIILVDRQALAPGAFNEASSEFADRISQAHVDRFNKAVDLLQSCSPEYAYWVLRLLRQTAVVEPPVGVLRSGSSSDVSGLIYVSGVADIDAIAEMLVHEVCHLYMHILCHLAPLADESDKRLYFSPVKGLERTIDKIALAYHAFANVALLHSALSEGLRGGTRTLVQPQLIEHLVAMQRVLLQCGSLTEAGVALVEPLYPRIENLAQRVL